MDPKAARLAALAVHGDGQHGLHAEVFMGGVVFRDLDAEVVVTCLPYNKDGGRLWFFAEPERAPLADADRLMDAIVAIKGRLAGSGR